MDPGLGERTTGPSAMTRPLTYGLLLAAALCTAACSGVTVKAEEGEAAADAKYDTYAVVPTVPPADLAGTVVRELVLRQRMERAIDDQMAGMGIRRIPASAADLHVSFHTSIEMGEEKVDPYFTQHSTQRFETGVLRIDVFDRESGQRVWRGEGRTRLRETEFGYGIDKLQYKPTGEERNWRVQTTVKSVLAKFTPR